MLNVNWTRRNCGTCKLYSLCSHFHLVLLWLSVWITLTWIVQPINSSCLVANKIISCRYNYMSDDELKQLEGNYDMILSEMETNFSTSRMDKSSGAKILTMQIQRSTIYNLTPKFFAHYSGDSLQSLIMSTVKGSYELDAKTLGGLENSLKTLRINDHELKDLSYLVMLKQLDSLQLVRTKLHELPPNFKDVLNQLKSLDLSENELTTMPWKYLAERVQNYDFHKVQLNKNKWHCDCSLEPILNLTARVREKIAYFRCHTPVQVRRNTLAELKFSEICPKSLMDREGEDVESSSKTENEIMSIANQQQNVPGDYSDGQDNPLKGPLGPRLATAGGLSPEVIAVIVAAALLLLIIISAAIIYKVRKRSSERRQQERNRGLAHKTNSYCAVIEHNPPGYPAGVKSNMQMQHQQQPPLPPQSKTNNHGRSAGLPPEREPLTHGYQTNYKDREL